MTPKDDRSTMFNLQTTAKYVHEHMYASKVEARHVYCRDVRRLRQS
jgi:hypothetical protein